MTRQDIADGCWVDIGSELDFKKHKNGRCNYGEYNGPGKYRLLQYQQRCPRGCCYDDVVELVSATDIIKEIREKIIELSYIMKEARRS